MGSATIESVRSLLYNCRLPHVMHCVHTSTQAENVNAMLKGNGGLDKRSCRPFGLAAHTIAALAHAVVHYMQLAARPHQNTQTHPTQHRGNRRTVAATSGTQPEPAQQGTTPGRKNHPTAKPAEPPSGTARTPQNRLLPPPQRLSVEHHSPLVANIPLFRLPTHEGM